MKEKISVIIPTIGRKTLKECLIFLNKQSFLPKEVILIDTSVKRLTKTFLKQKDFLFDLKFFFLPCGDASIARNLGIRRAKNNILAFLDDDCLPSKDWLKNLVLNLLSKKENILVMGNNKLSNRYKQDFWTRIEFKKDSSFFKKFIYSSNNKKFSYWLDSKNFAVNKDLLINNKIFFDSRFKKIEDLDLSLQLKEKGIKIIYEPKAIVYHKKKVNFFNFLFRYFLIKRDLFILNKKWINKLSKENLTLFLYLKYIK